MLDLPREELIQKVDRFIDDLLDSAGIQEPPVDAIDLAQRHLGMVVCLDRKQPQRGRAQRSAKGRLIYLRPEPTEERHQWTVAHEIGEHLKPSLLKHLGAEPGQTPAMAGESLANLLAYHLLVPHRWFADDAPHLLVVDDDRRIRDLLSRFLFAEGYRVTTADNAKDARAKLESLSFDLLIGTWEVHDARERGISRLVVAPCLLLTFIFGPAGWLLYLTLRSAPLARPVR